MPERPPPEIFLRTTFAEPDAIIWGKTANKFAAGSVRLEIGKGRGLNLTQVSVGGGGGGGEPEDDGAEEQHHRNAVHGAPQRLHPRRLPPAGRRHRVVRRQRRLDDDMAAALRHARPARRPPHPGALSETDV